MVTVAVDNMSIKYFDTLEYVQQSKKIKDQGALAEHQAKQLESALETAVQYVKTDYTQQIETLRSEIHSQDLATKGNVFTVRNELRNELKMETATVRSELKAEIASVRTELKSEIAAVRTELKSDIKDLRYDTLKFIVWTGVSVVVSVGGMLMGILGAMAHGFHWI